MKRVVLNAAMVLFSLALSLCVGEVAIRACYPLLADYDLEMWRYFATLK